MSSEDRTQSEGVPLHRLVLRCYVRKSGRTPERWVAHCIDLDLWASSSSPYGAKKSLEDAIQGYLEVVFDTKDDASIPRLLRRRAPLRFFALWYLMNFGQSLRHNGGLPLSGKPYQFAPQFQLV